MYDAALKALDLKAHNNFSTSRNFENSYTYRHLSPLAPRGRRCRPASALREFPGRLLDLDFARLPERSASRGFCLRPVFSSQWPEECWPADFGHYGPLFVRFLARICGCANSHSDSMLCEIAVILRLLPARGDMPYCAPRQSSKAWLGTARARGGSRMGRLAKCSADSAAMHCPCLRRGGCAGGRQRFEPARL